MAQEAVASTEIELGPFDEVKRIAMTLFISSGGDLSLSEATAFANAVIEDRKRKALDIYLNGMTIEEKIMGAVQEVIDNFETTYDKKSYGYEPSGYWKEVNSFYVYQSNTPAQPLTLG
jgi:hypothetical protein